MNLHDQFNHSAAFYIELLGRIRRSEFAGIRQGEFNGIRRSEFDGIALF